MLPPEDAERARAIKIAADNTRKVAHAMLDSQLDTIMPELLTAIDAGGTFAVLVVDPQRMPVIPEPSHLVDPTGKPLTPDAQGLLP